MIEYELETRRFSQVAARAIDVQLTAGDPTHVLTNFVTDGLNYVVVLTNNDQFQTATGTLYLDSSMRIPSSSTSRYAYEVDELVSSLTVAASVLPTLDTSTEDQETDPNLSVAIGFQQLQPRETKVLYLGAKVSGLDPAAMQMKSDEMRTALQGLPHGYDISAGLRALDYIDRMLDPATQAPLERVLAGLVQLKNMIFLRRKEAVGESFRVAAARLGSSVPAMLEPVSGEVQVLHLLNGHEEQSASDLSGSTSSITLGPTTFKHWDFGQLDGPPKFVTNLSGVEASRYPVEVHVHDPQLGTESFLLVLEPKTDPLPIHPVAP